MYTEDLILFYLPSLDEEVYRRTEFGLENKRSPWGEKLMTCLAAYRGVAGCYYKVRSFCSCGSSADQLICNQGEHNPWHCCEFEIKYWVNTVSGFWLQGSCTDVNGNKICSSKIRRSLVKRYCQQGFGLSIGTVVKIMFITCSSPVTARQQSYFKCFVTSTSALGSLFTSEVNRILWASMGFDWASLRTKHGWERGLSVWTPQVHMLLCKISNSASKRVRQLEEVHARSFFKRLLLPLYCHIKCSCAYGRWSQRQKEKSGLLLYFWYKDNSAFLCLFCTSTLNLCFIPLKVEIVSKKYQKIGIT